MLLALIVVLAYLLVLVYAPFAICAYRLMGLAGYDRRWRALVPLWNLFLLCDLVAMPRMTILGLLVPVVSIAVWPMVGGRIAQRTGRPKWIGWIAGFSVIHIVGLPALALAAPRETDLAHEHPEHPPIDNTLVERVKEKLQEGVSKSYIVMYLQSNGVKKRDAELLVQTVSRSQQPSPPAPPQEAPPP